MLLSARNAGLALLHLSLVLLCRPSHQNTSVLWTLAGAGKRFDVAPLSTHTATASLLRCAFTCYHASACASYNYHGQQKECQLLASVAYLDDDVKLVEDQGWAYYKPADTPPCPDGKYFLPYDVPNYLNPDPTVTGYTCSGHSWIAQKHAEGMTNCRMVHRYNSDFYGHDMEGFANYEMDYKAAMAQCLDFDCISMVCYGPTDPDYVPQLCWMKYNSHLTFNQPITHVQGAHYWAAECNTP